MFEALKASKEALDAARKTAEAAFKEHASVAFKEIFDAHPNVAAVRWTQYAPHFNDGEACVFSWTQSALSRRRQVASDQPRTS